MTGLPPIGRAMVMAAGVGSRMRPLTDTRPKVLVEVGGKALLDHMLDRLADDGVGQAVVNVHHFADQVEAHLAARTSPKIAISDERALLLETGGGLAKARTHLGQAPIFVCNSDSVWVEDPGTTPALVQLRAAWDGSKMDALLLLARLDRTLGFPGAGDFHLLPDGRLKRRAPDPRSDFAYMGVQIFDPRQLDGSVVEPFSTNRFWDASLVQGRLYGLVLEGDWMHVGDPQAVKDAEAKLREAAR